MRWVHAFEASWKRAIAPGPAPLASRLFWLALVPCSLVYRLLSFLKRAWFWWVPGMQVRVPALVVSIGNPTVGGTGKTPLAAWVARWLTERAGVPTAILVRGYGAEPSAPVLFAGKDGRLAVPPREVGDEGCWLVEAAPRASLIVAKRRADGARAAVAQGARAVVLDEGLQYWRLARDLDLVTLDAEDPWGNGWIFPAGPLREGPEALARAAAVVLRVDREGPVSPAAILGAAGRGKPVYAARYRPRAWRARDGRIDPDLAGRAARMGTVACGIARPERFFRSVDRLAGRELPHAAFPDHHRFTTAELAALSGPVAMTEKDRANLPPGEGGPEIWCLQVDLELEPLDGAPPLESLLASALAVKAGSGA